MQAKSRAARLGRNRGRSSADLDGLVQAPERQHNEVIPAAAINSFYREGVQRKVATTPGPRVAEAYVPLQEMLNDVMEPPSFKASRTIEPSGFWKATSSTLPGPKEFDSIR